MAVGHFTAVLGIVCLGMAGTLTALGHHDGVLGATDFEAFPAPGDRPVTVTARVVVEGTPEDGRRIHDELQGRGDPGALIHQHFRVGQVVPARFEDDPNGTLVLLRVEGRTPHAGEALVVRGPVQTLHVDGAGNQAIQVALVVLVDVDTVRRPLVF